MSTKKVSKIAVLTSGGDSPGMNAAIRAVVRTSIYHGLQVFGVARGYNGMIDDDIFEMYSKSVGNIIQRGGTILKSARSEKFRTLEGRQQAFDNLKKFINLIFDTFMINFLSLNFFIMLVKYA